MTQENTMYMMKRSVKIVCLTVLGIFLFSLGYAQDERYVRVSIIRNENSVSVKVAGFYQIKNAETGEILRRGRGLRGDLTYSSSGFSIAKTIFKAHKIFIKSDYPEEITVNGRKFSGNILFTQKSNSTFAGINYIHLEDYVKGVLYHEVSHYWPLEVLKAQAVVCRSFALYQMQANKNREFDVTNDIYSQVYGGRTSERYRTSLAVDRTKGIVLTYNGKILPAYFHSTCGGRTEDASVLWNTAIGPLKGVECGFCKESPHFKWVKILSPEELSAALKKGNRLVPETISVFEVNGYDESGRVKKIRIAGGGKTLELSANTFRNLIGPNNIRSTNFKVVVINKDIVFSGIGWGHGVGMCQWGAYFMSKEGYSFEQILKYYYPGVEIHETL